MNPETYLQFGALGVLFFMIVAGAGIFRYLVKLNGEREAQAAGYQADLDEKYLTLLGNHFTHMQDSYDNLAEAMALQSDATHDLAGSVRGQTDVLANCRLVQEVALERLKKNEGNGKTTPA